VTALGRHPEPDFTVAHLSDTHFLADEARWGGVVDTDSHVQTVMARLERSDRPIAAIVITGDLTDLGEPTAYRRLRAIVRPVAERLGAELVWVMGNHDERPAYAAELYGEHGDGVPSQDRVHDVRGLRIIALDSTVPGYHHGDVTADQLDWLRDVLAEPAPFGTLLALHHPPVAAPLELMSLLELRHQDALADVVRGTDVRAILAGHLHHPTFGMFAGIPVSVAASTCATIDLAAPRRELRQIDATRTFSLVEVRPGGLVHSSVPVDDHDPLSGFGADVLARIEAMTPEERIEAFSRKRPTETETSG